MGEAHRPQTQPTDLLRELSRSDEVLRQKAIDPLGKVSLDTVALAEADRIREGNYGYDTDESRQLQLIAALPNYIRAQRTLDQNRYHMSRNERAEVLQPAIEYNHILREMVDMEQYHTIPDFVQFIEVALLHLRVQPEVIRYASNNTRIVLNGMRHEIAAESLLSLIPEVGAIRSANADEELEGKDIVFEYRRRYIALDIKSSEISAYETMLQRRLYSEPIPVWSGFSDKEFGDRLILPQQQLRLKIPYYRDLLEQAVLIAA